MPQPLPEDEQLAIVQRLRVRQASQQDKEKLCESHLRLAINIAGRYAAQFPTMEDDLVSAACMAVWKAIEKAPDRLHDDNFTAFCVARIHSDVYRFALEDHCVVIPQSTISTRRKKGEETEQVKVYQFLPKTTLTTDPRRCNLRELQELIEKSTRSDTEREIIRLRQAGYKDREIGVLIGLSTTRVREIRTVVGQRFEQLEAQ